jgi:transcriptional regulator with XRE-family HTH domain
MQLKDRKRLARLIEIQEVSAREVARAAGWRSHSYLQRLIRGEVRTCKTEPAVRIATFLGVDVGDLFLPKMTSTTGQIGKHRSVKRPAA